MGLSNDEGEEEKLNRETVIQNKIRVALSERGCIVHRCNTGLYYSKDGRPVVCGEVGHSDLYGHRPDGKAFYLEIKTPVGRASKEQLAFIKAMQNTGALAGFARSVADAMEVLQFEDHSLP